MRKSLLVLCSLALMVAPLFVISASAQAVSRSLVLKRDGKIAGQSLSQGKYTIAFDEKKDGELEVLKDGKTIAKAAYKIVSLEKSAPDNVVVFRASDDGSLSVRRIELKGMKIAIQFE